MKPEVHEIWKGLKKKQHISTKGKKNIPGSLWDLVKGPSASEGPEIKVSSAHTNYAVGQKRFKILLDSRA